MDNFGTRKCGLDADCYNEQMDELSARQNALQHGAKHQIVELRLEEMLSPFGDVIVVGSVVTGLMTWPDIDIEVIVQKMPRKEVIGELAQKFFAHEDMMRVWMMDNRGKIDRHQPTGLYLGGKRVVDELIWKFDIWFLLEGEQRSGKDDIEWLKKSLTPLNKKYILRIKDKIANNPKYRKEIFSIDIYNAVIKEGVITLTDFKAYLKRSGRSL